MIRVFVLYPEAPDPGLYDEHVALSRREVPAATIRHGRVFGSPQGEPDFRYYFEYEFADMNAFRAARNGLQRSAEDAQRLGVPFEVYFANVE